MSARASGRLRKLLVGAFLLGALAFGVNHGAVYYLSQAPNADETAPTAPREDEHFFKTTISPPETIAYTIVSNASPSHTVFVLHGLRDSRGSMLHWARALADAGARAVVVDARGHGRSTGARLSYGVRESLDLVSLTDALASQGLLVGKVGVLGFSCGGATAIQWAGRDSRIAAVFAVAPFATMEYARDRIPLPVPDFVARRVISEVGERSRFDPNEAGALPWVDKTRAPILFFHGSEDKSVRPENSRRLFARAPQGSELVIEPNETHASALRDDKGIGRARATAWFANHLR